MFQCLGWMRKNFIHWNFSWSIAAETWDASCLKKGLLEKPQSVQNTCTILPLKKIFYQNLTVNRWIFQIPLKYIKLVIPKILFMLVLCSFNFYFKITWPPTPTTTTKIEISDLPLQARGGACPESSIKTKSLDTKLCPVGLSPWIICQKVSPILPEMSQNCCPH